MRDAMLTAHSYLEFLERFSQLSVYQVDHLCKHIVNEYAAIKPGAQEKLTVMEIRHIFTEGIKQAHLFLAQQQVEQARTEFDVLQNLYLGKPQSG